MIFCAAYFKMFSAFKRNRVSRELILLIINYFRDFFHGSQCNYHLSVHPEYEDVLSEFCSPYPSPYHIVILKLFTPRTIIF